MLPTAESGCALAPEAASPYFPESADVARNQVRDASAVWAEEGWSWQDFAGRLSAPARLSQQTPP